MFFVKVHASRIIGSDLPRPTDQYQKSSVHEPRNLLVVCYLSKFSFLLVQLLSATGITVSYIYSSLDQTGKHECHM